jgi:hypothetical protein
MLSAVEETKGAQLFSMREKRGRSLRPVLYKLAVAAAKFGEK